MARLDLETCMEVYYTSLYQTNVITCYIIFRYFYCFN